MATERKAPDAFATSLVNLSGAVANIGDDPDSPDGSWLTASGNNINTECHTSFPTPTGDPNVGSDLQEFRIQVRQFDTGQSGNPDARIELWENGSLVRAGSDVSVTGAGQVIAFTWNANELATADGSLAELKVIGTKSGGSPGARNSVEVGAVEWNVDYSTSTTYGRTAAIAGVSTAATVRTITKSRATAVAVVSTVSAVGSVRRARSAQISATSNVTAIGTIAGNTVSRTAAIAATSAVSIVTAIATRRLSRSVAISSSGAVTATAGRSIKRTVLIAATSTVAAIGSVSGSTSRSATIAAISSTTAMASRTIRRTASITSSAVVAVNARQRVSRITNIISVSSAIAVRKVKRNRSAAISGQILVAANANRKKNRTATIACVSSVSALGQISGSVANIIITASGRHYTGSASRPVMIAPQRYTSG